VKRSIGQQNSSTGRRKLSKRFTSFIDGYGGWTTIGFHYATGVELAELLSSVGLGECNWNSPAEIAAGRNFLVRESPNAVSEPVTGAMLMLGLMLLGSPGFRTLRWR
jgi:hypothetical protein